MDVYRSLSKAFCSEGSKRQDRTHTSWSRQRSLEGKTNKHVLISLEKAGPPSLLSQAPKPKQLLFIIPQKSIKGMENVGACGECGCTLKFNCGSQLPAMEPGDNTTKLGAASAQAWGDE